MELSNRETQNRKRLARYLKMCLSDLGISDREAEKRLKLRSGRISNLHKVRSPQLRILCPLGELIQEVSREQASKASELQV